MRRAFADLCVCLAIASAVFLGCGVRAAPDPGAARLEDIFTAPSATDEEGFRSDPALRAFYAGRGYTPAWTAETRLSAQAALADSREHGLDGVDDHLAELQKPWPDDPTQAARRDVLLTQSVLRYVKDLRLGHTSPTDLYTDAEWPRDAFDAAATLQQAIAGKKDLMALMAELSPPRAEYARLRDALARYRSISASGGWQRIPDGPTFDAWSDDGRRGILARRLAAEDARLTLGADVEPEALDQAVRRFQRDHGLAPDGRIGPRTLAALNVPASRRVEQLRANLEYRRWMPRHLERRRIEVNVAAAELEAFDGDQRLLASRVIVGDRRHPTPILRAEITGITVNPPWNVPSSIAREEILPRLRKNPRYLQSENMVLLNGPPGDPFGLTVNWKKVSADNLPYRFQQLPGPNNALGTIKLELPNRFDVYLHDTPAKALFARADRALSHGCIRVERILDLASFAVSGDPNSGRAAVAHEVDAGLTRTTALPHAIPVYLVYWTAVVEADGSIGFRDDLYGRDAKVLARLGRQRPATDLRVSASGCPAGANRG